MHEYEAKEDWPKILRTVLRSCAIVIAYIALATADKTGLADYVGISVTNASSAAMHFIHKLH